MTNWNQVIERGIELEQRAAAGDKRAEWDLVALEKEHGLERSEPTPAQLEDRQRFGRESGVRWAQLDDAADLDGIGPQVLEAAMAAGRLSVETNSEGERLVRLDEWEAFRRSGRVRVDSMIEFGEVTFSASCAYCGADLTFEQSNAQAKVDEEFNLVVQWDHACSAPPPEIQTVLLKDQD